MSKARSTGNLNNSIVISDTGAITFVSGSTTLATINTTGQISGSTSVKSAATASYADSFIVASTLTAQTLVVQTITSSVSVITGSTSFGSTGSNTHTFTGSLLVTGSTTIIGQGTFNSPSSLAIIANGPAALSQASPNTYSLGIGNGGGYDLTLGTTSSVAIIQSWSNKPLILNPVGNNVGIGTTNTPSNVNFGYADTRLEFAQVNTTTNIIESLNSGRSASTYFSIYGRGLNVWTRSGGTASYVQSMTLTDGGNVGIGTTVVTAPLTVAGTTDLAWSASTSKLQISRSGTVARLQNYDGGSAANISLAWDGGNIGIGTQSPGCKLDLTGGNMALNDNKLLIRFASDGNHSLEFNSGYNGPFLFGYTGAALGYRGTGVIWTSNTNYFNYSNTTTWNQTSDIRAKQNINTITNAIDKITLLNPVTFDYTDEFASQRSWADKHKLNNVGFIAQEYENVFPDDVNEVEEKIGDVTYEDFKTINTTSIVPYLVKAIQELKVENDTLKEILQRNNIQ